MQAEPVQPVENHLRGCLGRAFAVRIFDTQAERPLMLAGMQPAIQCRAYPADMQITGRAGGKTRHNHKNLTKKQKTSVIVAHPTRGGFMHNTALHHNRSPKP